MAGGQRDLFEHRPGARTPHKSELIRNTQPTTLPALMSSSKPRDAYGRFSRTDPPTDDGGDDDNGTIDPQDSTHADSEPLRGRSDSVELPSQVPEGGDHDAGTDGNDIPEDEENPENERCENNAETEALREAVKRGLQQWVDSLTSQQDFNDATEAFRSAGIAIPVPAPPMANSHTLDSDESQPASKKCEDRAKGEVEEDGSSTSARISHRRRSSSFAGSSFFHSVLYY